MVFSSVVFLFLFLPVCLLVYHFLFLPVTIGHRTSVFWRHLSNFFLLATSLLFYFWGEGWLVLVLVVSTVIDYFCGLLIGGFFNSGRVSQLDESTPRTGFQRAGLIVSIASNLAVLLFFKYFNFGVDSLNAILPPHWRFHNVLQITLPLGISFYVFQSMSYTIDVYRGHVRATRNLVDFLCYVVLFPQLVAGPIIRYCDVAQQLVHRTISTDLFVSGINRFCIGLGKKVLIANTVAKACDKILELPSDQMTTPLAWIMVVCYALQIYYDFSGYSDMAIGLGRMLGFQFLENFNYPYISKSIQEFWRRWHISLSTWFRDYLYIPLGGSRLGTRRTYLNLFIVFFICGLWHGANWAFVIWGLYHGVFLILERTAFGRWQKSLPRIIQHLYTLLIVMTGWILFATESYSQTLNIIKSMWGFAPSTAELYTAEFFPKDVQTAIVFGLLFSMPVWQYLKTFSETRPKIAATFKILQPAVILILLIFSSMALASGTHNPFIYFRF